MTRFTPSARLRLLRCAAAVAVALLATGVTASASLAGVAANGAGASQSMPVPVDRQFYVTAATTTNPSDGSTVDPYDADPSSIHVAVNGGQEFARSFVHLALDYLPSGASATGATLTLHVTAQSDASSSGVYPAYNVNQSAAIVEACVLTTELTNAFDPKNPPAYDCQHGSAVGKSDSAGDAWTFNLKDLVAYWSRHGNTGAALIPVGSGDPTQTWAVAFYKSRSSSVVMFDQAPAAPATTGGGGGGGVGPAPAAPGAPAPAPPVPGTLPGGVRSAVLPAAPATAASLPAAGAAPTVAAAPASGTSVGAAASPRQRRGVTAAWPLVLAGCLLLAAGSLGVAHRHRLAVLARRIGPPTVGAFRRHPRAYTVASVAAVWGLVFSGYSLVVQPAAVGGQTDVAGTVQQPASGGPTAGASAAPGVHDVSTGARQGAAAIGRPGAVTGASAAQPGPAAQSDASATELSGPGTYQTIDGVRVFFPANGGPPVADLYHGADDTIGISPSTIRLCAHAALTYGSAFNISASDLDVYWRWLNDHGGIYGRKVTATYQNDNYDPGTAVQAAQACKDWGTFMLLGGIGFDQIPAVRQWAEQNHELYYHHIATIENTAGLRYSFSPLPTVEQMGTLFGQLAVSQFAGKKIGILYRNSSNWIPGVTEFTKVVNAAGGKIVGSYPVTINQGNYTQELVQLQSAGAQVVFAWENALATVEMIKQAQGQSYHPAWLVFPFNLETNTLGSTSLDQPIWGVAAWDAYDPGYYGGGFAPYAADIHEFEAQYKQYDPNASLSGDGGDLLFLNWEGERQIADLFQQCGPQCTRNRMAGLLLAGYDRTVPPNCNINFGRTSDHHHGGYLANVLEVVNDPNGRPNFVPKQRCVSSIAPGGGA